MWRTFLIGASLAALLMQCTISVPTSPTEDHNPASNEIQHGTVESNIKDDATPLGKKHLTLLAFKNYTTLYNFQLLRTLQIAKDVLADPEVSGMDTEEMREERKMLADYVKGAKDTAEERLPPGKTDKMSRYFFTISKGAIVSHFEGYVHNLNESQTIHNATDTQTVLWQAILRHGWTEYHQEVDQRLKVFATNFANDVLQYVSSLNPTEQEKEKELVEFCQEYEQNKLNITKMELGILFAQGFMVIHWDT